jgi:hypothetical protein
MCDASTTKQAKVTVGLDLSDRCCQICVLDEAGEVTEEGRVTTKPETLRRRFSGADPLRIVIEAGTHSPWVSRPLSELGHDVIVANPRKLRFIYQNDSKSDRVDAPVPGPGRSSGPGAAGPPNPSESRDPVRPRACAQSQCPGQGPHPFDQSCPRLHEVLGQPPAHLRERL